MDVLERTQKVIDLSDEIVEINRRILDRAKAGLPEDRVDKKRLSDLLKRLQETGKKAAGKSA